MSTQFLMLNDVVECMASCADAIAVGLGSKDGRIMLFNQDFSLAGDAWVGQNAVREIAFHGEESQWVICVVEWPVGFLLLDRDLHILYNTRRYDTFVVRDPPCKYVVTADTCVADTHMAAVDMVDVSPDGLLVADAVISASTGRGVLPCGGQEVVMSWKGQQLAMMFRPRRSGAVVLCVATLDGGAVCAIVRKELCDRPSPELMWCDGHIAYCTPE